MADEQTPIPTSDVADAPAPDASQAPEQGEQQADPRADITQFAERLGRDPKEFEAFDSLASAQAAVKMQAEALMRAGMSTSPTPAAPPQPQPAAGNFTPQAQPQPIDYQALGFDEAQSAALEQLAQQQQQILQRNEQLEQYLQQQEQATIQQQQQSALAEANQLLDSYDSQRYGKSPYLTPQQQLARDHVFGLANMYNDGAARVYGRVLSMRERIELARMYDDPSIQTPQTPQAPQQTEHVLPQRSTTPLPNTQEKADLGSMLLGKWSENPQMRAAIGLD